GFTGIEQQIEQDALYLRGIEPTATRIRIGKRELDRLELRQHLHVLNRVLHDLSQPAVDWPDGLAMLGEAQKRADLVRPVVAGDSNLLEEVLPLILAEIAIREELGVSQDRGQWVAQVVRNSARHTSYRGQTFGLEDLALALLQLQAHPLERRSHCRHLVVAA